MYDIIGDIHGHAGPLQAMLEVLGYDRSRGFYSHPNRQVIFVGDFIDRGPEIQRVLDIVRPMCERGAARAVLGNHELNLLAYCTRKPSDANHFCRPHTPRVLRQKWQTLRQLSAAELDSALEWFRTLPFTLDLETLRVVHACWDPDAIAHVTERLQGESITDEFLEDAYNTDHETFRAIESLLKGREVTLPQGVFYTDKEGTRRTRQRIRWFERPASGTYASWGLPSQNDLDEALPEAALAAAIPYPEDAPPVFFGHYWLTGPPSLLTSNVACVDYSVAKGGSLCAYRFDGEATLDASRFVTVSASEFA